MRPIPEHITGYLRDILTFPTSIFEQEIKLPLDGLKDLVDQFVKIESQTNLLQRLGTNYNHCLIIGDIHGNRNSIMKLYHHFMEEKVSSLVFTGDYVDRGEFSMQVLILLLILKVAFPLKITILRGNHEDLEINKKYGFIHDIEEFYEDEETDTAKELIDLAYNYMSIAAITPAGSLCVHGGIPKAIQAINEIENLSKPYFRLILMENKEMMKKLLDATWQIMWNDPKEDQEEEFVISHRSNRAYLFNEQATTKFLENSGCRRLIRAHEASRGGYQKLFDGKIHHIFSSEPYFGKIAKASVIEELNGEIHVKTLDLDDYLL